MYTRMLIKRELEVKDTLDNAVEKLTELGKQDQHLEKLSDWKYMFLANESYGTLLKYGITGGIRLYVDLDYKSEKKTQVVIKSKPRLELILYVIGWLGFILAQVTGNTNFPFWLNIINVIIFLFGWLFYRRQEISLLKVSVPKIKNALQP